MFAILTCYFYSFVIAFNWNQQEREHYEYIVVDGKIVHKQTGELLDTSKFSQGAKWIFVMSTFKKLYASEVEIEVKHPFA